MECKNSFDKLDQKQKEVLMQQRKLLNQTFLRQSIQEFKERFFLTYKKDEGFCLIDGSNNNKVGYVNIGPSNNGLINIRKYGIDPIYQKYGFSTLMLGLFCERMIPKISRRRDTEIHGMAFSTKLLRENITKRSTHYFHINKSFLAKPNIEEMWRACYHKTMKPHQEFNAATSHIHIGKYAIL